MFTSASLQFLADLRDNNDKTWFEANRARWEGDCRGPALDFVRGFRPRLAAISPHFLADDRAQGGSLFRIFRDTRFSKDKSPYKTHLGIQFRHAAVKGAAGEVVHAPGFYLHIAPEGEGEMDGCFGGFGMWHPEGDALQAIRRRIDREPEAWARARAGAKLEGESLKKVPTGFSPDHPHAEDLRRKDFFTSVSFSAAEVCAPDFVARYAEACGRGAPLMKFLCETVGLPF